MANGLLYTKWKKTIEEDDAPLLGTPAEIIARLRTLQAGGVQNILMADPSGSAETLRAFKREVMSAFEPSTRAAAAE